MLVLSRKEGERLIIDGGIVVTVLRVAGGGVRLGLEAPPAVRIRREEIIDRAPEFVASPLASGTSTMIAETACAN